MKDIFYPEDINNVHKVIANGISGTVGRLNQEISIVFAVLLFKCEMMFCHWIEKARKTALRYQFSWNSHEAAS